MMRMALKIMLLASFAGKSHAGLCAVDSDYKADLVMVADCTVLNSTQCVGLPLKWSKKCEVHYSPWLTKEDGSELKAACEAKGGTFGGQQTCSTFMAKAFPSGFTASATKCKATSDISASMSNAQATSYLGESYGCCGAGLASCSALDSSYQLCKTGFQASSAAQVDCFGLAKAKCAGTADNADFDSNDFDKGGGLCRINSRKTGTNLVQVCTKHGGYAASAQTCGAYVSMFFPSAKASNTTCAAESLIKGRTNKGLAYQIASSVFSCCASGSTTCCDDAEFCAKSAPSTTSTDTTGTTGTKAESKTTGTTGTTGEGKTTGAAGTTGKTTGTTGGSKTTGTTGTTGGVIPAAKPLVITGSVGLNVPDADAFMADDVAKGAVQAGIADSTGVAKEQVAVVFTKGRRLSEERHLAGASVNVAYTITLPASAGAAVHAAAGAKANAATKSTLTSAISAKVTAAKGNSYAVSVASMSKPAVTGLPPVDAASGNQDMVPSLMTMAIAALMSNMQ